MADFVGYTVSNEIKLTPEEKTKVMEIVDKYYFGMNDCYFGNENTFGIWGYDWLNVYLNDEDYEPAAVEFFEELQPLIPKSSSLVVECIGHEKLRYVSAVRIVVNRDGVEYYGLGGKDSI